MKFFKLDLLTLLISLFILNSCKNQDTIGLGVTAANQLNGSLIDTSTVIVNTVPEDSILTSGVAKAPLGFFRDPIFGTTESNLAINLNLPGIGAYSLPAGTITIDSAILVLRYAHGFYGDSLASRYKVNVYQLNEGLASNGDYYNTKSWNYNSNIPLGSKSFFAHTHDSVGITTIVTGGPDTIQKMGPQVRIPIDKNFVNNIFFNASPTILASNLIFKNTVKGLYLTMDKTGTTGAGGTLMIRDSTTLDVYYKTFDGTTTDTAVVSLPSTLHASQIKRTYAAAIQTELANQTSGSRNAIYLQGGGLRTKISFPYIKNLVKSIGSDIVINRAELVISPSPGSTIPFAPLPKLTMYQLDIANQRVPLQDATPDPRSPGLLAFGGFFSQPHQTYNFLITAYISDLMRGVTKNYGTFIGPVDIENSSSTVDISATSQTTARTFAVGTDKTSPYRIKLNIIYTKIAK